MSLQGVAARGRIFALKQMTDQCIITRESGRVLNTTTGQNTPGSITIYTGICRVRPQPGIATRDVRAGEQVIGTHAPVVSVPVEVVNVASGDIVTVTVSLDPGLIGRRMLVQVVAEGSQITARRLLVQEMSTG